MVVLIPAHACGGAGGYWGEQVVVVAGRKMAEEVGKIMHSSRGGGQRRLVRERVLSENLRKFRGLTWSIKTIHALGFVLYIAKF